MKCFNSMSPRRTNCWLGLMLAALVATTAQGQSLTLGFTSPATNTSYGAPFVGSFTYSPNGAGVSAAIISGETVINDPSVSASTGSGTVTLTPIYGRTGLVEIALTSKSSTPPPGSTNTANFTVLFRGPSASLALTPGFTSPVTNSSPGAAYTANFTFTPTNEPARFNLVVNSATISPQPTVSITTNLVAGTVAVTFTPSAGTSGNLSATLFASNGFTSASSAFTVNFKSFPPTIAAVGAQSMNEDATNVVAYKVSDPDTPAGSLTFGASSSNTNLIDTAGLTLGGSGTNRTVTLVPKANINGSANITLTVTDGVSTGSQLFALTVNPQPDPPVISGLTNLTVTSSVGAFNILPTVSITDVDQGMPSVTTQSVTVTVSPASLARLPGNSTTYVTSGTPAQVTAALQALQATPTLSGGGVPGSSSALNVTLSVNDGVFTTNANSSANIEVVNSPPDLRVFLNPTNVIEGTSVQPFRLTYLTDIDLGDDNFTLVITVTNPAQAAFGTITPTNRLVGNEVTIASQLETLFYNAASGVLTTSTQEIEFTFEAFDGFGTSSVERVSLQITQVQTPPSISGIPVENRVITDRPVGYTLFPTAFVSDSDGGGSQPVRAIVSADPALGTFSTNNTPLLSQGDLNTLLRSLQFTPTPGLVPVGGSSNTLITLTVIDEAGLTVQNNNLTLNINGINNAPQFPGFPEASEQPVLIPPAATLLPFAEVMLTSDDTNAVFFSLSIDVTAKGTLSNLGAFVQSSPGTFTMSGSVTSILASLTNITYHLNPGYTFPPSDPGGTTFTLSARDYALLTKTVELYIQVQGEPRHHIVTRALNDGLPGSFTYALSNIGNGDVITFSLPSYPAIIRMPGTQTTNIIRNLTLKGPGANLLTISGDNNGDSVPDRQIFQISATVTIEGITLAHGTANYGGAVQVLTNGVLNLIQSAVVDSEAVYYGGGIDVNEGRLALFNSFIGRNRVSVDNGVGGGGLSIYTTQDITIEHSTFATNVQANSSGDGGGAIMVENSHPGAPISLIISHSTFAGNIDAADQASSIFAINEDVLVEPVFSIFADDRGRNLEVAGNARFISGGRNISDDSTQTSFGLGGTPGAVFLLDHVNDLTDTDPLLAPLTVSGDPTPYYELLPGSPAINLGLGSSAATDQRSVLRTGIPDAGAYEFGALGRLVINEIYAGTGSVHYIELYTRRDSTPVDLYNYKLLVDGEAVHSFKSNIIVGANDIFTAGQTNTSIIRPGFGMTIAFSDAPVSLTANGNANPVIKPSIAPTNRLPQRSVISIVTEAGAIVARQSFLMSYLDPSNGTNLLDVANESIALAPQFRGYALIPHSYLQNGPFEGGDFTQALGSDPQSPNEDAAGTPFGQDNALPLALANIFTVTEDELAELNVLANDFDSDISDRVVVVDVSTGSAGGSGDASSASTALGANVAVSPSNAPLRGSSILYDARVASSLQQLPVATETIDTFYYEIIDIGSAALADYEAGTAPGTVAFESVNHRLTAGEQIIISGSSQSNYNGTFAVTIVDEDHFAITNSFFAGVTNLGVWQTVLPRSPSARSEAAVSVRVLGVNDAPVAGADVVEGVTERSVVRVMTRPELAGSGVIFPSDPSPVPVMLATNLLSNDDDIDTDDDWTDLRVVGIMGAVHEIAGFSGSAGASPVTVSSTGHGLTSGDSIMIANYGGHPSYNGYHTVSVVDDDSFTIPRTFVDDHPAKGVWVTTADATATTASSDVGAGLTLVVRVDVTEDHLIYDASASSFLQGLAEGERYTNRIYYTVRDRNGGSGIGAIDVVVSGVNHAPEPQPDPGSLTGVNALVTSSNSLASVLGSGLDYLYSLPPSAGGADRLDVHAVDRSGTIAGTIVLNDVFATDEDTLLSFAATNLTVNDSDIDRTDTLTVISVDAVSREGAPVNLAADIITYNPTTVTNLQALMRNELVVDSFEAVISDGATGGNVTSLVAVLVTGVNDSPVANPVFITTHEDQVLVFDPRTNAVEIDINGILPDDKLTLLSATNVSNPGLAPVSITTTSVVHDATLSDLFDVLEPGEVFTNTFSYTVRDDSFLLAMDDTFSLLTDRGPYALPVLANDRDYIPGTGTFTVVEVSPAAAEGTVTIASNGLSIIYAPPFSTYAGLDHFRYIIRNAEGAESRARVTVRMVEPEQNGLLRVADDRFAVALGEIAVMDVLANDGNTPGAGAGLTITRLVSTSLPGQPVLTNNQFVYNAVGGPPQITFTYEATAGGSSRGQADVVLDIYDLSGALQVQNDTFHVLAGSLNNQLPVLDNDGLLGEDNAHYRIRSITGSVTHGTIATNATGTGLVYTPDDDFIGTEQVQYLATDGLGLTGSGTVTIVVGKVEVLSDYYTLSTATNLPVTLDILENDRMLANLRGSLSISAVSPSSSAIGSIAVGASSSNLVFAPNMSAGQTNFSYVVTDLSSPARVVTGVVTVATVPNGTYANPDRYAVRGNGQDYQLNVLANDIGYPAAGRVYSITSIGTGADAPDQGGIVQVVSNRLVYTPAEGFTGEESFTYTMTDAVGSDSTLVTISVRPGDIVAAPDRFAVYYEQEPGTNTIRSFSLPVLNNDAIQPPLDQVLTVSAIGIGANAPDQGGEASVTAGGQTVTYRPVAVPAVPYYENFTYEVSDGAGRQAKSTVEVLVRNRASNLVAITHADHFAVGRDTTANILDVLANDAIQPADASAWTISSVSASSAGATIAIVSGSLRYTPPAGFTGRDTFTYNVTDGFGGTGNASVNVQVGSLPVVDDAFVVVANTTSNLLDVLINDPLGTNTTSEYSLLAAGGTDQGGSVAISGAYVAYTPAPAYTGLEYFQYTVQDDSGQVSTGVVAVTVLGETADRSTALITLYVEGRAEPYTNAYPQAVADVFTVKEDDTAVLLPLANDTDADSNDRSVIVDISTASGPGTGSGTSTITALGAPIVLTPVGTPLKGTNVSYDPRAITNLQQLPVGVEIEDTFFYEIIDYGSAPVEMYEDGGAGTTRVHATNHRLTNGAQVVISGATNAAYNGAFTIGVSVVNDDIFTIPVAFAGDDTPRGAWEDETPRYPTARSEAQFTVRVIGVNDPPVATDDIITNVTERQMVRLMVRPENAGTLQSYPATDPVPAPDMLLNQEILSNDTDIDTDDDWSDLRVIGVMSNVNVITGYSGIPGTNPVTVTSTDHGLTSGDEILIANYGGHVSYNGYHTVTVIDDDSFTIPRFFVDDHAEKGVWVILNDANRYQATTDVGATISLTLRTDALEDHLIYNAFASSFLQGLAEGEQHTNRFYYAVSDRNDGIGIGAIDVIVDGVNNTPVANDDPDAINQLDPLLGGTNTLDDVLAYGIDPMYILPSASGSNGLVNLQILDRSGTITGTVVISDLWMTDEDTAINIPAASLLVNDTDVDRTDVLNVIDVDTLSREGAALSLGGGLIAYQPAAASNLQALARGEYLVDSFDVLVSDSFTAGTVTSTVAVLVVGVNDSPTAVADYRVTHEDQVLVWDTRTNDMEIDINAYDPDDQLRIIVETNVVNSGQAHVYFTSTSIVHDATASFFLQQLADFHHPLPVNQSFTNSFSYTVSDHSFLFATDDQFDIPYGGQAAALAVLVNDRDFTPDGAPFSIVDAGPALFGGAVGISSNAQHLVYQAPTNHLGPDYFRYTIRNQNGSQASALVSVRSVDPKLNGILQAADDDYTVAAGQTLVMDVTANDGVEGVAASPVITRIVSSSIGGQPVLTNNTFIYTPTTVAPLTFRYEIAAGGMALAEADVTVDVIERRGTLMITEDAFSVPAESSDNRLPVLVNDGQLNRSIAGLVLDSIAEAPANGVASVDAGTGEIVYAPNAGFTGIDTLRYLASDGVGGTGTGTVRITVGVLNTATDYFTVLASGSPATLDVLHNDRLVGAGRNNLLITQVTPASTSVGSLAVGVGGTNLVFTPNGTSGQGLFDYVVEDASVPARSATVRVTIDTVSNGTYANADRFVVRGGGTNVLLDVLANDVIYPAATNYTIAAVGGGAGDPDQGGSIAIAGDRIAYTPLAGFYGEESFEYTLSDGLTTDVTRVTVSVRRGDLLPIDDRYAVIYEVLPGESLPTSFTLPILANDRITPELGQTLTLNILGTGTNGPSQGGSVSIASNGTELIYRPVAVPSPDYVESFTYEVTDGATRRASARVSVRVGLRPYVLGAQVRDDAYTVAYNSTGVAMPVLDNDGAKIASASGWTITSVDTTTSQGGSATITGSSITYNAPAGFVGVDTFTYQVADGVGGTGGASVTVRVGNMPVVDDRFTVISSNEVFELDVISNDLHLNPHADKYLLRSVANMSGGGATVISVSNRVLYAPDTGYTGDYPYTETFEYTVEDDSSIASTARVSVVVHEADSDRSTALITLLVEGRNDLPVITNDVTPFAINDKQTIRPFLAVDFTEIDEQLNERVDVTVSIDDPVKGALSDLAAFVDTGGGLYVLTNTTAAGATAAITNMLYTPVENRITVPTTEPAYFTITITDHKSPVVVNTNTVILVTATNDPVEMAGTRADQRFYYKLSIDPFNTVQVSEVDDLTLQPLTVTITLLPATNGLLSNLGSFVSLGGGQYRATGITAAEATTELQSLSFSIFTNIVIPPGTSRVTRIRLTIDDGFASPIDDLTTSLIAFNSYEGQVRPSPTSLQENFGFAVDTTFDFAVVGAPLANARGQDSGAAFVYRWDPASTNTWSEWRQLLPSTIETNDEFGISVSMNRDRAAVGAIRDEGFGGVAHGRVYIFERNEGGDANWGQSYLIVPTNMPAASLFGQSISLDGDLLAVGAPDADIAGQGLKPGAVLLFQRDSATNSWSEIMRWYPTNSAAASARLGWKLSLHGDHLVVGAHQHNANAGAVFHFYRHEGGSNSWGLADIITTPGTNMPNFFGLSVSLENDLLAIGAPEMSVRGTASAGRVFIYDLDLALNRYSSSGDIERQSDAVLRFGSSLDFDRGRLFVGARGNLTSTYPGSAYLFDRVVTNWTVVERINRPAGSQAGNYGISVGFNDGVAIVGAPVTISPVNNFGYAFMYRFVHNQAPASMVMIPDQLANVGDLFSYTLPAGLFFDADPGSTTEIDVSFPDGTNGLSFTNGIISGVPVSGGVFRVVITGIDDQRTSSTIQFAIRVLDESVLADNPYNQWLFGSFGSAVYDPGLESAEWGPDADPDGDGRSNREEYAFGTDPTQADSNDVQLQMAPNGDFIITYLRRSDDPAIEFKLQGSQNMAIWLDLYPFVVSETIQDTGHGLSLYSVRFRPPVGVTGLSYRIVAIW